MFNFCLTDSVAIERNMRTPSKPLMGYAPLYLTELILKATRLEFRLELSRLNYIADNIYI